MKISLNVDQEICKKCYSCIAECPFDLINKDKEGVPQLRKAAIKKCIHCGHCMAVCMADALDISISPLAISPSVDKTLLPDPESVDHFLMSRRSIRTYKKKVADRSILEQILDVSRYAPSAHNCQPVHWIMVENPEEVQRIAGLVVNYMRELKVFPGLIRAWDQGVDKVLRGAPHLAIAHADPTASEHPIEDCTLATAYLDLAAHSHGIGSCWAGFLVQAIQQQYQPVIDALDLPVNHKVYTALMLGYPKFRYSHIPQRDPLKITWK
jgi:nitroreductase/NAD-dependent dihydropyrimidine dehydrogenase PreA subunit